MSGYRMDTAAFDALAYGLPNVNTLQYLQQGIQQVQQYLTPIGQQLMAKVGEYYEAANGSEAMRKARAAINKAQHLFQSDVIMSMNTIGQMQNAGHVMQRYLMAHPTVQQMFEDQRLEGFAGMYQAPFPGQFREQNYNWRRVMNGVMQMDEDPEGSFWFQTWDEQLLPGDRELELYEKRDILNSWEAIEMFIKRGCEDPTSRDGGYL
jgi:hypothetical protein